MAKKLQALPEYSIPSMGAYGGYEVQFIRAGLEDALLSIEPDLRISDIKTERIDGSLDAVITRYKKRVSRYENGAYEVLLLITTKSDWTLCLGWHGGKKGTKETVRVMLDNKENYELLYYDGADAERRIEQGWWSGRRTTSSCGTPLAYELEDERFAPLLNIGEDGFMPGKHVSYSMLDDLLHSLGIDVCDDSFLAPEKGALLVDIHALRASQEKAQRQDNATGWHGDIYKQQTGSGIVHVVSAGEAVRKFLQGDELTRRKFDTMYGCLAEWYRVSVTGVAVQPKLASKQGETVLVYSAEGVHNPIVIVARGSVSLRDDDLQSVRLVTHHRQTYALQYAIAMPADKIACLVDDPRHDVHQFVQSFQEHWRQLCHRKVTERTRYGRLQYAVAETLFRYSISPDEQEQKLRELCAWVRGNAFIRESVHALSDFLRWIEQSHKEAGILTDDNAKVLRQASRESDALVKKVESWMAGERQLSVWRQTYISRKTRAIRMRLHRHNHA